MNEKFPEVDHYHPRLSDGMQNANPHSIATLDPIPYEIKQIILTYLIQTTHPPTIASLIRASKSLHNELIPKPYQSISLSGDSAKLLFARKALPPTITEIEEDLFVRKKNGYHLNRLPASPPSLLSKLTYCKSLEIQDHGAAVIVSWILTRTQSRSLISTYTFPSLNSLSLGAEVWSGTKSVPMNLPDVDVLHVKVPKWLEHRRKMEECLKKMTPRRIIYTLPPDTFSRYFLPKISIFDSGHHIFRLPPDTRVDWERKIVMHLNEAIGELRFLERNDRMLMVRIRYIGFSWPTDRGIEDILEKELKDESMERRELVRSVFEGVVRISMDGGDLET